ncbi:hemolysin family protein [Litorilinea aerophila]|uniref:HlyC/CorC family transporter n=1 Tax=Litorilinea aerophila TaxID=1204385 RepID=A0A540VAB1_9CHLR|nr:hemolysin family protein [Litorilinea aerophila]MCC9078471.1 hemolysin family protein [Litorilinea aerophila]OUC07455.1 hypothetical protein RY27_14825 [Litorilinea aerophila]
MTEFLYPIGILLLLIVVNGFFVAAEFAIAAVPPTRVAQLAEAGSESARRVLAVVQDRQLLNRYISTAQVGITIASLGLGMYGEHTVAEWLVHPLETWFHLEGSQGQAVAHTLATILAVALLTYLHVVVGEMVPKSLALQSAAETALRLSWLMAWADVLFRPLTLVLNWIGDRLLTLVGLGDAASDAGGETQLTTSRELAYIVEESGEGGLLAPSEQTFLENVFDFHERTVSQVMTPRTRIAAIPVDADLMTTLAIVCEERHSRYPVYEGDRDHIVGVLYVKDLARHLAGQEEPFSLRTLMRPAVFVPETLPLETMLVRFRREHIQIAIVLDEYGGTAGLVTLEDLAEELIGEIQDEFDEEIPPFVEIGPNRLRVRGDLLLDELTQHYGLTFDQEDADTVGGLIMAHLGHVARPGDEVTVNGVRLVVEAVDGLAISTALLEISPESGGQSPESEG